MTDVANDYSSKIDSCEQCFIKENCKIKDKGNEQCLDLLNKTFAEKPFNLSALFSTEQQMENILKNESFIAQIVEMQKDLQLPDEQLKAVTHFIAQNFVRGATLGVKWYEDTLNDSIKRYTCDRNCSS